MRRAWCLVALALDAAVSQQTSCPAGQGIDGVGPSGNCSHCPAGKQSSAGGIACTDCLESTRPSDDQAGCVCDATQTVSAEELQCDDGCRPGQECVSNATSGTASCTQCPEGKQSPDGVSPCSYCRFTMQPTRAQDGCVCAELHFNVWNSTSANVDLGCSPCSAVKVELAGGEESSCQTTGTMRACGKDESGRLEHPGVAGGRSRCDNSQAQCECSGGPKGESSLCARDGFWIKNRYDTDMDGTLDAAEEAAKERLPEPVEDVDQAASVSLVQCVALRGKRSRCLHWSRCIGRTADVRWSDDDPYGEWNLDEDVQTTHVDEYGYHYVNDDRTQWGYTLMPDGDPPESGRDGPYHYIDDWEFSKWLNTSEGLDARCPHASNCCYPGFAGKLCDKCAQQTAADGTSVVPMKIGQSCVICEPGGINYGKLLSGLVMSFGFTLFIMRKASTTFQDADGTIAIAIFYFQIVALLFKDRAAEFGWFLVGLVSFMELGFLRNTEGTCVIKLNFYENFYFSIFSTLAVVSLSYGALIGLCILTSHETSKEEKMLQAEEAKCRKIVEHLLSHIPLFEGCTGEQMDVVASGMKLHFDLDKNHVIKKANDPKGVFVVVISGAIAVEHVTGRRGGGDLMGEYKSGHHYGEGALFAHGSKHIRIRAKKKHTTVMVLSKAKFMKLKAGDKLICEAVLDRVYEVQHSSDTALMEHGMTMHDLDSSGTLNITEAEAWLRARRFDPSQEFLRGLFKKFDADQNGEISQVEFKEVLREADALEDHFNHFDNDDSGTIDVDELAALMKACDSKLSKSEIDKLAKELDTNKSGDIDFDEFCEMMLERKLQIVRESLDNHYDPVLHAHIEGGEDALMGYSGIRRYTDSEQIEEEEAVRNTDQMLEREENIERVLLHQYKTIHRQNELAVDIEVRNSCCVQLHALLKMVNVELMSIYVACSDRTAQQCAILEMVIALYGPLTLVAMSMLFCWTIDGEEVLVVDSTQTCYTDEHYTAYYFAWIFLLLLTIGCPLVMWYAAVSFYTAVEDHDTHRKHAKEMAMARYHSSWKAMKKKAREKAIEQCAHELRLQMMGAHSFLLTSFQMSVTQGVCNWYPQWHLVRRTILNFLYFEGMRSTAGQVNFLPGTSVTADWRVLVVVVLAISNLLQTFFRVFRDEQEDNLEMWSLHFLLVVVVIDIANEDISLYLCLVLSSIFSVLVVHDMVHDKQKMKESKLEWGNMRKLVFVGQDTGKVNANGKKIYRDLAEAERYGERLQEVKKAEEAIKKTANETEKNKGAKKDEKLSKRSKSERKFVNPLSADDGPSPGTSGGSDSGEDSTDEDEGATPTNRGQKQLHLIQASTRLGNGNGRAKRRPNGNGREQALLPVTDGEAEALGRE